eukprot:symbB.v1.2.019984.t1/scaffold1654.1/size107508/9
MRRVWLNLVFFSKFWLTFFVEVRNNKVALKVGPMLQTSQGFSSGRRSSIVAVGVLACLLAATVRWTESFVPSLGHSLGPKDQGLAAPARHGQTIAPRVAVLNLVMTGSKLSYLTQPDDVECLLRLFSLRPPFGQQGASRQVPRLYRCCLLSHRSPVKLHSFTTCRLQPGRRNHMLG